MFIGIGIQIGVRATPAAPPAPTYPWVDGDRINGGTASSRPADIINAGTASSRPIDLANGVYA